MITAAAATIGGISYSAGDIVAAYEYDAFGNTLRESGPYAASNPFRYSTKYTDIETGLVYYGQRYYSPSLGRFLNRDPIEESGGLNLYGFCGNNAVNRWDYLGMNDFVLKPIYMDGGDAGLQGTGDIVLQSILQTQATNEWIQRRQDAWAASDAAEEAQAAADRDRAKLAQAQAQLDSGQPVTVTDSSGNSQTFQPGDNIGTVTGSNGNTGVYGIGPKSGDSLMSAPRSPTDVAQQMGKPMQMPGMVVAMINKEGPLLSEARAKNYGAIEFAALGYYNEDNIPKLTNIMPGRAEEVSPAALFYFVAGINGRPLVEFHTHNPDLNKNYAPPSVADQNLARGVNTQGTGPNPVYPHPIWSVVVRAPGSYDVINPTGYIIHYP